MRLTRPLALGLAALLVSCAAGGEQPSLAVRDSAGIRIVENARPSAPVDSQFRLAEAPMADIGGRPDDPAYDLLRVRGALRLASGHLAVVNGQPPELRLYDEHGQYLTTMARQGQGPGELEGVLALPLGPDDTIYLYDYQQRRLNRYTEAGGFAGSGRMQARVEGGSVAPAMRLPDGEWAAIIGHFLMMDSKAGYSRDTFPLVAVSRSLDSIRDTIAMMPGPESFIAHGGTADHPSVSITSLPFGVGGLSSGHDDHMAVADGKRYEVVIYDVANPLRPTLLMRRAGERLPISEATLTRDKQADLEQADDRWRAMRSAMWDAPELPTQYPAIAGLLLDRLDRIWMVGPSIDSSETATASVFDADGRWLEDVTLPAHFTLTDAGADYVLGIWKDESDVEHVRMYELER